MIAGLHVLTLPLLKNAQLLYDAEICLLQNSKQYFIVRHPKYNFMLLPDNLRPYDANNLSFPLHG
jgi:hypothetical protein